MSVTSTHSSLAPGIAEIPRALNTSHLLIAEQLKDISEHPSLTHVDNFSKFTAAQITALDFSVIMNNTTMDNGTSGSSRQPSKNPFWRLSPQRWVQINTTIAHLKAQKILRRFIAGEFYPSLGLKKKLSRECFLYFFNC